MEFSEYNAAFESTKSRILNNAISSATNSAVNIDHLPKVEKLFSVLKSGIINPAPA